MEKRKSNVIPGTVLSTQNGHLLVSSGVVSLDSILGESIFFSLCSHFNLISLSLINKRCEFELILQLLGGGLPVGTVVLLGKYPEVFEAK